MTPLVEFLLARIAEDEAAAGRAGSHNGRGTFANDNYGCLLVQPARVLAWCEAQRRIMELHYDGAGNLYGPDTHFCAVCTSTDGLDDPGWPCPTLRALALPYSSHPEYDEAWRP